MVYTKNLQGMQGLTAKEFQDVLPNYYRPKQLYIEPELFSSILNKDDFKIHRRIIYVEEHTETDKNMRKLLDAKLNR